jgi:hypothetical protein
VEAIRQKTFQECVMNNFLCWNQQAKVPKLNVDSFFLHFI